MTRFEQHTQHAPKHVAIIMDGNGRWAKAKGKLRTFGHKAGVEAVRASVRYARKSNVQALTLFAFSSENWNRPQEEVGVLMELFMLVLSREVKSLHKNGVKLRVVGDLTRFDKKLVEKIDKAQQLTANNRALTLNIAANYGGRWDIIEASKKLAVKVDRGELNVEQIDEALFDQHTSLADLPDLDLLIRTGGESRISNFLLWQLAYSELVFTPILWPDFDEQTFADAVTEFNRRQRRFGLTGEQVVDETT